MQNLLSMSKTLRTQVADRMTLRNILWIWLTILLTM